MGFFAELKRRNVFRVGIAYLLGGWVLLQGADFALDVVGAPNWIIQVLTVLAAIGLPAVLIFAWVFEMTPEGLRRETEIDPETSITPQTGHKLDRVITGFLVLAVLVLLGDRFLSPDASPARQIANPAPISPAAEPAAGAAETEAEPTPDTLAPVNRQSVAVLPFAFRSNNPEDEFFAEGMHDDLLTQLAKIGSLKVISRTSVMEYKDTTKKIPEIAQELGVASIVEGGVQRSGSRVRINAQLIDASDDEHLWAETYNRELTAENLFEIQAEISLAIANALQATLSPEEQARLGNVLTDNLEAWESYQRASRMRFEQSTDNTIAGLIDIDHALELDPEFAAAYSLKAILLLMRYWFWDPDPTIRSEAWAAIETGRQIDPDLAELDMAEGYYHYWGFLNYADALVALDRALEKVPNDDRIHQARGYVMRREGRFDEAIASFRVAAELNPRNVTHLVDIANTLTRLGRFEESGELLEAAQELNPVAPLLLLGLGEWEMSSQGNTRMARYYYGRAPGTFPEVYSQYWLVTLGDRDFDAALDVIEQWPENMMDVRIQHYSRPMLEGLTYLYAGQAAQARPLLLQALEDFEQLLSQQPNRFTTLRSVCVLQGALGNLDDARTYCQRAYEHIQNDAFMRSYHLLEMAVGLALVGDDRGAMKLLRECLELETTYSTYDIDLHPAFDGLRDHPVYIELMDRYRLENRK